MEEVDAYAGGVFEFDVFAGVREPAVPSVGPADEMAGELGVGAHEGGGVGGRHQDVARPHRDVAEGVVGAAAQAPAVQVDGVRTGVEQFHELKAPRFGQAGRVIHDLVDDDVGRVEHQARFHRLEHGPAGAGGASVAMF